MRRFLKKPRDLSTKQIVEPVIHINKILEQFPDPRSSTTSATKMPEDKIIDLLEASIPQIWQRNMGLQGFRPLKSSIKEFAELCKKL